MSVAIVGGGLAAANVASELREAGYDEPVTIYSEEDHLPYERPPLSKSLLMGKSTPEDATVHDEAWYAANKIDLRRLARVTRITPSDHTLEAEGKIESYKKLVLATGAAPRMLPEASKSGKPVFYLRTIEHSLELREAVAVRPDVAIVGGGWIGLEVAAAAREAGCDVTAYVAEEVPLEHALGKAVGSAFLDLHRAHGVKFELDVHAKAEELTKHDIVVCGVGVDPRISLALRAGLDVDKGVKVDAALRSSDPDIYAVGDIASHDHPLLGHRLLVEHWDNAIEQGKHVARNIAGGDSPYERMPYFFSDQYELGMEYFGHAGREEMHNPVIEGDLHGAFRAWWVKDGIVTAAMQANDWDASDELRASVGKPYAGAN